MADKKFDLGDYVEVKDRIRVFYELFGAGRLVTEGYQLTREPDDKPKVIVTAAAYRTPDDPHPAIGTSWMYLPGKTSYTLGSEIENVETSAWGRAIGALGILIDRSIATTNEIDSKKDDPQRVDRDTGEILPAPSARRDGTLVGIAKVGTKNTSDGELRVTPVGHRLGFRLEAREGDKGGILVEVDDPIAEQMATFREAWLDQPVTAEGIIEGREFTPAGKRTITYQALVLHGLVTPTLTFPLVDAADEAELDAIVTGL